MPAAGSCSDVKCTRLKDPGDPSVGISVYATALWLIGRINDFAALADPSRDEQALDMELLKIGRGRLFGHKPESH